MLFANRISSSVLAITIATLGLFSGTVIAATFEVTSASSQVEFLATGRPGFLKIRGQGASLKGRADLKAGLLSGDFTVELSHLKTGIELRDEHMRERYLETSKFPEAKLVVDPVKIDEMQGGKDIAFTGKLTIKGKENPVNGNLSVEFSNGTGGIRSAKGDAKFKLKIADFPMGVPSHMGVTVADSVEVSAQFVATESRP